MLATRDMMAERCWSHESLMLLNCTVALSQHYVPEEMYDVASCEIYILSLCASLALAKTVFLVWVLQLNIMKEIFIKRFRQNAYVLCFKSVATLTEHVLFP